MLQADCTDDVQHAGHEVVASFDPRGRSARGALPDQRDSYDREGVAQNRKVGGQAGAAACKGVRIAEIIERSATCDPMSREQAGEARHCRDRPIVPRSGRCCSVIRTTGGSSMTCFVGLDFRRR
jgi:hypothetical protein